LTNWRNGRSVATDGAEDDEENETQALLRRCTTDLPLLANAHVQIGDDAKRRQLEQAGLVTVARDSGKAPRVTLCGLHLRRSTLRDPARRAVLGESEV
jgi:hypothetical protein